MKLNTIVHRAFLLLVLWLAVSTTFAQLAPNRYALILEDPPAASRLTSRASLQSADVRDYRQLVEARQRALRSELTARNVTVTGSVSTLLNAVFVAAPPDRVEELRGLPGVKALVPLRRYKMNLNRATQLVNAPAAWSVLGGVQNGGTGIKIGILDTGIDQTHPAFQDSSLPVPAGYPRCSTGDCVFTNNKVIVARSYVKMLAAGTSPSNPAADSRPDDYSARDHEGHGTAVASCAAGVTNTGKVGFSGVAPKAYLGSYKIIGSPEVNDFSSEDAIIQALEDAVDDDMDIVSFSIGSAAFSGAADSGAACGLPDGVACDLSALAFENAGKAEVTIVVAAGNTGQDGNLYPSYNTISSPAHAPSVIAVGATSNSHYFAETVSVPGSGVPAGLQNIVAAFGDALIPVDPVTAPLVDVTRLGNDGLACSSLPTGSLNGSFALILRGTCFFFDKVTNAVAAGAVGVVFYNSPGSDSVSPAGLTSFLIPVVMISDTNGAALKSFIAANPGRAVTIDPVGEREWPTPNQLIEFSARGPSTGDSGIKPELVAPGVDMFMAAASFDPLGILYDPSRYAVANGTSFSTPLVSGAAALVKQRHPGFTPAQVKSALVNAASQDVTVDESSTPLAVDVRDVGAGKLDVAAAINATVTANPSTISFGALKPGSLPATRQITLKNSGASAVTLTIAVVAASQPAPAPNVSSLPLAAGASGTVTLTLVGLIPQSGAYSGAVTVQAAGVSLRIPYMYLVGTGNAVALIPLSGDSFSGTVGQPIPEGILGFKLVDSVGVPVSGVAVSWSSTGTATLLNRVQVTDAYGIATAEPVLGQTPGNYSFTAAAGGQSHIFSGSARRAPSIATGGVVDAASFSSGRAVAPGSYMSIFGAGLSESIGVVPTDALPLAMDFVTVSFDVPSAGISVPGRMVYISPSQINVQVPWELQGQSAAQVKVTIDFSPGNVLTVPLANYAPAFFEIAAGRAAAVDGNDQIITSANPARGGSTVYLFLNGLGPVTNQPASGQPALDSPLSETTTTPVVTIGGQQAANVHGFLTPTLPGLYQITATVPSGLTAGTQPISVTIGGRTSPTSGLPVQ